nr:disease resistance protein RUN1-like [Ziziphus jujuba var. spinosa]
MFQRRMKSSIARAFFNQFADEFEGSSFLEDVRETSKKHLGFVQLQETLLFDMLKFRNFRVGNAQRGINLIRERLRHKRVLLVLDDVDDPCQLEKLAGRHEWFGSGSRIIITTRNKHLLTTHGVDEIYEVQELNHHRALELLSWHAFKMNKPQEDYLMLSDRIVVYCSGLPLALEVLGSLLNGRKKPQWESLICNLEKKPEKKIYEILKISYDALQEDEKASFLDIACFFVGEYKDYATKVIGDGKFCPIFAIEVLIDMSLIRIESNKLRMHHLIQEMGKEIVRQQSPEVGKRSRLWSPDDVFEVFSENTGTKSIEGIMLKLSEPGTLYLNSKSFKRMKRLRILIFSNVILSGTTESIPHMLRMFELPGYQFSTFPFDSVPKQLVILSLPYSHIEQPGQGFKINLENLKVLNFSHSTLLREIPDLSKVPNLECLHLDHCTSLIEIHEAVGSLTKLVILDLQNCSELRISPRNLVSTSFRILNFRGCSRLQNFPNIIVEEMKYLRSVDITGTAIKEPPFKIELLIGLRETESGGISSHEKLMLIPTSTYKLMHLELLDHSRCSSLSYDFPLPIPDELLDNPKFQIRTIYDRFGHGDLNSLDNVLGNSNLSSKDFLLTPGSFDKLFWLDRSKNEFLRLPFFGNQEDVELVMHISGINHRLIANLPT